MSVYSNTEIAAAIESGDIVCVPHEPKYISEASLDITLGYHFYRTEKVAERTIYNPFDAEEVERYFDGPYKAMPHEQWVNQYGLRPLKGIPLDHPVVPLKPGERILAHTHEFVGIRAHAGASEVKSRSSWGRNGIAVCFDAGWIDPGWINRITLEIYNLNQHETVLLPVGERIGQLIFHYAHNVEGDYGNGRQGMSGKYQLGTDLDTIIRTWTPDQMLPKAFKDVRYLPAAIEGLHE
nr:RibD C-terminal domain protein [uncultured bacterium]